MQMRDKVTKITWGGGLFLTKHTQPVKFLIQNIQSLKWQLKKTPGFEFVSAAL